MLISKTQKDYNKMTKSLIIHPQIENILEHEVYLVGGYVRDYLLGTEPKDYDFTTSLTTNK